jgi:hypothetical protein
VLLVAQIAGVEDLVVARGTDGDGGIDQRGHRCRI